MAGQTCGWPAPKRGELDPPIEIPHLVYNLLLVDILPQGLEYRLVGTNFVKGASIDMTGMMVQESGRHAHVVEQWICAMKEEATTTGEPRFLVARFAPQIPAKTEVLLLPLSPSTDGVPKILGGLFVEGTFPPGAEIEALDLVPIID